jgi:hypothetical protein
MVVQDGREVRLGPGDFACYDSTRPYTLSFGDAFEQLVLHMPRALLLDRLATGTVPGRRVSCCSAPRYQRIVRPFVAANIKGL